MDKILILGGTGMIGHMLFTQLSDIVKMDVYATVRSREEIRNFPDKLQTKVLDKIDVNNMDCVTELLLTVNPTVVLNCVGLTKRLPKSGNFTAAISLNALFPQRLAVLCQAVNIRLIHFSTDCVFSGEQGHYVENDIPDATDTYGKTKGLGEVTGSNCLTLRSSMIGHELKQKTELLEWFLSQHGERVRGFRKAIFSGITTLEMAKVIGRFVLPNRELTGLYHVSACPISKFDLLEKIAAKYGKNITIEPVDEPVMDKSLNSNAFCSLLGYCPPSWEEMLSELRQNYEKAVWYKK
ncbi:MAG: dTDP-4-dehydrorhamnose reductase family protein [Negativicutes bacterium]